MFEFTDRSKEYLERVQAFMDRHIYPTEETYEEQTANMETSWNGFPPVLQELKAKAKAEEEELARKKELVEKGLVGEEYDKVPEKLFYLPI